MTFIHILDINPLSFKWFANIFYSVGCLFILLMVSFAVLKMGLLLFFLFFYFLFFRATLVTYEVPRLGVESEL